MLGIFLLLSAVWILSRCILDSARIEYWAQAERRLSGTQGVFSWGHCELSKTVYFSAIFCFASSSSGNILSLGMSTAAYRVSNTLISNIKCFT